MRRLLLHRDIVLGVGLVAAALIFSGCATMPPEMKEQGIVAWSYQSPEGLDRGGNPAVNIQVRVTDLTKQPPAYDGGGGGAGLMRLLPLTSLAAPPVKTTNAAMGYDSGAVMLGIKQGEVERILAEELRRSGAVKNAVYGGPPLDYDIRGTIDFVHDRYWHSSGFGTLLYVFSLVGVVFLPDNTAELTCTARLEVVSKDGKKVVLSKDYEARSKYFTGLIYGNLERHNHAFGKELLPQIIGQFVADLRGLPKTAWK